MWEFLSGSKWSSKKRGEDSEKSKSDDGLPSPTLRARSKHKIKFKDLQLDDEGFPSPSGLTYRCVRPWPKALNQLDSQSSQRNCITNDINNLS